MRQLISKRNLTATLSVLAVFMLSGEPALADTYDDQIAALKQQANQQQQQAAQLHATANDYQSKVNELNAQIGALQAQINLNQAQYDRVTASIQENETKLATQKQVLSANIKTMYLDSSVSPLEMLASSSSISDFMDQQQYQDKIKTKIQDAMKEITALQQQLKSQQTQVAALLVSQQTQRSQLADARAQVNQLLATAENNAAAADASVRDSNAHIASLKAQQAAVLAAASRSFNGTVPGSSGGSGGACDNGHGNGGYPMSWCNAPQDSINTPWGYSRECVSWAGYRRSQLGRPVYGWGNANQWADGARASGYNVDSTPEVGAVAQTSAGYYGHVAVVEAISGSNVIVSEMNYDNDGHYRQAVYSASYFVYIH